MPGTLHIKNAAVSALLISAILCVPPGLSASSTKLSEEDIKTVEKSTLDSEEEKKQRQTIAVMLAEYEIEGRKLLDELAGQTARDEIDQWATNLLSSGEIIIDWARFRLAQCDAYLEKSLALKVKLADITREALERDYHLDGALPKAPAECYHIKDTFVHPATVLVLTRDDPTLADETMTSIRAEIMEVLGHTEVVRQLIIY